MTYSLLDSYLLLSLDLKVDRFSSALTECFTLSLNPLFVVTFYYLVSSFFPLDLDRLVSDPSYLRLAMQSSSTFTTSFSRMLEFAANIRTKVSLILAGTTSYFSSKTN